MGEEGFNEIAIQPLKKIAKDLMHLVKNVRNQTERNSLQLPKQQVLVLVLWVSSDFLSNWSIFLLTIFLLEVDSNVYKFKQSLLIISVLLVV